MSAKSSKKADIRGAFTRAPKEQVVDVEYDGITHQVLFIAQKFSDRQAVFSSIDGKFDEASIVKQSLAVGPLHQLIATAHDPETRERLFSLMDLEMLQNADQGLIDAYVKASQCVMPKPGEAEKK